MHVDKCAICDNSIDNYIVSIDMPNQKIVCHHCIDEIELRRSNILDQNNYFQTPYKSSYKKSYTSFTPTKIKSYLDDYIIGQDEAKKILSVSIYNHYKKIAMDDPSIRKSNILMIGPTGTGKTYLVKLLAKILDLPLVISPATALTEAGYKGEDVESLVVKLLNAANGDIAKAEKGIIFIDEIDKLAKQSMDSKELIGGIGVQQSLLPILEGTKVTVPTIPPMIKDNHMMMQSEIDTSNILFICGGAFPELNKIMEHRLSKRNSMGFNSNVTTDKEYDTNNLVSNVKSSDLIEFGLIPEFIGRLPVLITLESLSIESLRRILVEPKDSIISQYQKLFKYDSVDLTFNNASIEEIAKKAYCDGTGARSLQSITEKILLDLMFELPAKKDINKVCITENYVIGR